MIEIFEKNLPTIIIVGFIAGFWIVSKLMDLLKSTISPEQTNSAPKSPLPYMDDHVTHIEKNAHPDLQEHYARILGIRGNEGLMEILGKYHTLTAKYHPSVLNKMSEEQRQIALQQLRQIDDAYDYFRKNAHN